MTHFDLDNFLPYQMNVLAKQMSEELERTYWVPYGIRIPEWRILAHLSQTDAVSVRDLERRVDLHKSRVSRAAQRLEKAGLITNSMNRQDRRLRNLKLTPKGMELMNKLEPLAREYQRLLLKRLGETKDGFCDGLNVLLDTSVPLIHPGKGERHG